jgi:hypothetical protein
VIAHWSWSCEFLKLNSQKPASYPSPLLRGRVKRSAPTCALTIREPRATHFWRKIELTLRSITIDRPHNDIDMARIMTLVGHDQESFFMGVCAYYDSLPDEKMKSRRRAA